MDKNTRCLLGIQFSYFIGYIQRILLVYLHTPCLYTLCQNLRSCGPDSGNKLFLKNVTRNLNIIKTCVVCEALIEIKCILSALCFAWKLLYSAFKMRFVRSQAYVDSIKV